MDFRVEIRRDGALHVPNNSFMNWLRDRIANGNLRINFEFIDSHKYKWISDAITPKMNNWNINTPVFISAQTGTGKNTFIQKKLLRKVYEANVRNHSNDKILLLSNRVALNRQSKYQYAQYLYELTGQEYYTDILDKKTSIDEINILKDFGVITICSYQQLYEDNLLDNREYKYVICDECHFFTSDAKFNISTAEILQYIVSKSQNSIRIYMTATLETVFEAIIRAEMQWIDNKFIELEKEADRRRPDVIGQFNIQQTYSNPDDVISNINRNIDNRLNQLKANIHMTIHFYYMSRNYDYIEEIYSYNNHEELAEIINASKDKWLIFVPKLPSTRSDDALNKLHKETVQLSRNMISTDENAEKVYDELTESETFNVNVLITTSLLDNGINIRDKKLKNVVIEVFDRTEFIQMLGRVRVGSNDKIRLYIREYSTDELKKFLKRDIKTLVMLLYMDSLSGEGQEKYWRKISQSSAYRFNGSSPVLMFKFSKDKNRPWSYNEAAIIQIIDSANRIFDLIRKADKNFLVKLNDTDQARLIKVRNYYVHGEGQHKSWSRNVVDLIETEIGLDDRFKSIQEEQNFGFIERHAEIEAKYSFKFNDNFLHYLYAEMIPNYFNSLISNRVKIFKDSSYWGRIAFKFDKQVVANTLYPIEELRIIRDVIRDDNPIDIAREEQFVTIMDYYLSMAQIDNCTSALNEQLSWIEKNISAVKPLSEIHSNTSNIESQMHTAGDDNDDDIIKEKIRSKIISKQQFDENSAPQSYANRIIKFESHFLTSYGIKNNSPEANWLSKNYCHNANPKKLKDMPIEFESFQCTIEAVQSKRDNSTYYLLVKKGE